MKSKKTVKKVVKKSPKRGPVAKVYTMEKVNIVKARVKKGEFINKICKDLGMDYKNFCRFCRKQGVKNVVSKAQLKANYKNRAKNRQANANKTAPKKSKAKKVVKKSTKK